MSEQLQFFKGLESALPTTYVAGALYHCTDTGNTYLAISTSELELYSTSTGKKSGNGEIFNDYVNNIASGNYSHAEGHSTTASKSYAHAEGYNTTASGKNSHAEGNETTASGIGSHAEGEYGTASGKNSHVEGHFTEAAGENSHAEGYYSIATEEASHAEGMGTIASYPGGHAQGTFNIGGEYLHVVGNGYADNERSNAHTLDANGSAWFAGGVYVGSTSGTNKDSGSLKLATLKDIDDKVLIVTVGTDDIASHSPAQIQEAYQAGKLVYLDSPQGFSCIASAGTESYFYYIVYDTMINQMHVYEEIIYPDKSYNYNILFIDDPGNLASKSYVDSAIRTAITSAIGGSY